MISSCPSQKKYHPILKGLTWDLLIIHANIAMPYSGTKKGSSQIRHVGKIDLLITLAVKAEK